ncbi:MAG TPA: transposase [Vicinamibacterales bacterium]|jgi:putative transposase|nr:transposase [Vicinamibacterales bacterium]
MPEFVYHVLNRGVRRAILFEQPSDYRVFERILMQTLQRFPVRVLAYCAMPNHWHLIVWPTAPGELPRFMHWLTCTDAQRWHACRGTSGTGAVYQGRYKAIPIESDRHFLRVCRYVERNPLRAGLVAKAEEWRWSSLWRRCHFCEDGMHRWPVDQPLDWLEHVNEPQNEVELAALRWAIQRNAPFGSLAWRDETARLLNVNPQFLPPGRPPGRQVVAF